MSINNRTKERLTTLIQNKGHTIVDCETTVKTEEWIIQCRDCYDDNSIRVNNLTPLLNNYDDIKCKNCKLQKKIDKFLKRCQFSITGNVSHEHNFCHIKCNKCNLFYEYTGDYQDCFKCYCCLNIKNTEHVFYKKLSILFSGLHAVMSKEVRVFGDHKVDIKVQVGDKVFLFEVDDPGHFNPKTSQGLNDIRCIEDFFNDNLDDVYLVHINEDDVYRNGSIELLTNWIFNHLDDEPREKLLLIDSSGKNRYKYLNLENHEKYTK